MICGIELTRELEDIDLRIRHGESRDARRRLQALLPRLRRLHLNHELRPKIASLAALFRRVGSPLESLQLLKPLVRSEGRKRTHPSAEEAAEYGVALVQIGAVDEGAEVLSKLDFRECGKAQLFLAFAKFSQWDYESSIPLIMNYLRSPGLTPYEIKIGQANLLSALVHQQRTGEAQTLAREFLRTTEDDQDWLLHGIALQLMGELAIGNGDWREAKSFLARAERNLETVVSNDRFYLNKWNLILKLKQQGRSARLIRDLAMLKKDATGRGDWETLRDLDFHLCQVTQDPALFSHLYHGSPFAHYRIHLLKNLPKTPGSAPSVLPTGTLESYIWRPSCPSPSPFRGRDEAGDKADPEGFFDLTISDPAQLRADAPNAGVGPLVPGQVSHRLLSTLASDFYKPFWVPTLFAKVFPGRHYNSASGPLLVRQSIFRLRETLQQNQIPLQIQVRGGRYRLTSDQNFGLRVGAVPVSAESVAVQAWRNFALTLGDQKEFRSQDVMRFLKGSERQSQYWIKTALESGRIEERGRGPQTRYCLLESVPQSL